MFCDFTGIVSPCQRIKKLVVGQKKKRQLQLYLFIALSTVTAIMAYTIESWRWGALAFTAGFLLIAVATLIIVRKENSSAT